MKKRIVYVIAGLAVVLAILCITAAVMHTSAVKARVLNYLVRYFDRTFGIKLSARSLDYNLLKLRFRLNQPMLYTQGKSDLPPFFQADSFSFQAPLSLFFGGRIGFKGIEVVNARAALIINADGSTNIPFQDTGLALAALPEFTVNRLFIKSAQVSYRDFKRDVHVRFPGFQIRVQQLEGVKHRLDILLQKEGCLRSGSRNLAIKQLAAHARFDNREIELIECEGGTGWALLRVQGKIRHYLDPGVDDLELRGKILFKDYIKGSLGLEVRRGKTRLWTQDVSAAGLQARGELLAAPGKLSGRFAVDISGFKGLFSLLKGLEVNLDDQPVKGWQPGGTFRLQGQIYGTPAAPVLSAVVKGDKLSLPQGIELKPEGTLIYDRVLKAKLVLRELVYKDLELGDSDLQAEIASGRLKFQLHLPGLAWAARGTLGLSPPYALAAKIHVKGLSLKDLVQRLHLEAAAGVSGHITAAVFVRSELNRLLPSLSLRAEVQQMDIAVLGQSLKPRSPFSVVYDAQGLTIPGLELTGAGTGIRAAGRLPSRAPAPGPLNLGLQLDCSLLDAFIAPFKFRGRLKIDAEIRGTLTQPRLKAELRWDQGSFQPGGGYAGFEDIRLSMRVSPNAARIDSLSCRWGSSRCHVQGHIPLPFPGKKRAKLVLNWENASTSLIQPMLPPALRERLKGQVSGRFEVQGKSLALTDIGAAAWLDRLEGSFAGLGFHQAGRSKVRLEEGKMIFDSLCLVEGDNEENRIAVKGSLELGAKRQINLSAAGEVEARVLNTFFKDPACSGKTGFELHLAGALPQPLVTGSILAQDMGVRWAGRDLSVSRINGKISLANKGARWEGLTGFFKGGSLACSGGIDFEAAGFMTMDARLQARDVKLDYPAGLYSEVSGDLHFKSAAGQHRLSGNLTVNGAVYKEPFNQESKLFGYLLKGEPDQEPGKVIDPFGTLSLDIGLHTAGPLRIDNNICRAELKADLSLTGAAGSFSLSGRAVIKEGSEIYLNNITYTIERGTLDFVNPHRIDPELDISARTRLREYDIRLKMGGTPSTFSASFSSTPALSEADIISLLVTEKILGNVSASVLNTAGSQALLYLSSAVTGKLEQTLKRSLGIDSVRIDGSLVAARDDPGARITIGQRLSPKLEFILSQELRQTRHRTLIFNYLPLPSLNLQGTVKNDNRYIAAVHRQHDFGLKESPAASTFSPAKKRVINSISLAGDMVSADQEILKVLKSRRGRTFDFFTFQRDQERLRNLYIHKNYLNCSIDARKEEKNGKLDIVFDIRAGAQIRFEFQGEPLPPALKKKMKQVWVNGQFEDYRLKDVLKVISRFYVKRGYHQVKARLKTILGNENSKVYVLMVSKGKKYRGPRLVFLGSRFVTATQLTAHLKRRDVLYDVFTEPEKVSKILGQYYRSRGFLEAKVAAPTLVFEPSLRKTTVRFPVEEGQRYKLGQITFTGNRALDATSLKNRLNIHEHDIFSPQKYNDAVSNIRAAYSGKGYLDGRVRKEKRVLAGEARVDLHFTIEENRAGVIKEIDITGNVLTHDRIIRRELTFKKGEPVNLEQIGSSRKRLYALGIFEWVNISLQELDEEAPGLEKPYRIEIKVTEFKPWRLQYGLQYDSETSLGVEAELQNRNFLGTQQSLGTSLRLNIKETDYRIFFRLPYFFQKKLPSLFSVFINKREEPTFTVKRSGFTFQQQFKIGRYSLLSYNYTLEKNQTTRHEGTAEEFAEEPLQLGHLTAAYSRDNRSSLINPVRGMFFSSSLQYSARFLGSDAGFIRCFLSGNIYKKIGKSLVLAAAARLGLASGFGRELLESEKLYAGGAASLRGFGYNELGVVNPLTGEVEGGEALFILNQEVRFPIFKKLGGVLFLDLGNVYPRISALDLFNVRKAAGLGLRYHTPWLLFRLDWGFKLDRRPGESLSRIFFSIGQSF